jgi:hypothetical protein
MTNEEQLVLETLHSGPESLTDLRVRMVGTMTLREVLDALWALQDAMLVRFSAVDGMYYLR